MGIFLKHSYNVAPIRWGSIPDIQYAIKQNAEKVYGINPDDAKFALPLFWGLPILGISEGLAAGTNYGAAYRDRVLNFNGNDYVYLDNVGIFRNFVDNGAYTTIVRAKTGLSNTRQVIIGDWDTASFSIEFGGYLQPSNHITTHIRAASTVDYLDSGVVYDTNTIYSIAVNWDTSTRKIFVQGKEKNSDIPATVWSHGGTTTLGRAGTLNILYLTGFIEEIVIFTVALTNAQVALFNDLPYGLYQPVPRPYYLLPIAPSGWTGKVNGVTNPAKINGVAVADIASVMGIS